MTARNMGAGGAWPEVTMAHILATAAQRSGFSRDALTGPSRRACLVLVRQAVMYVAAEEYQISTTVIGRALQRDHSTVCHGRDRVARLLGDPAAPKTAELVATIASHARALAAREAGCLDLAVAS